MQFLIKKINNSNTTPAINMLLNDLIFLIGSIRTLKEANQTNTEVKRFQTGMSQSKPIKNENFGQQERKQELEVGQAQ